MPTAAAVPQGLMRLASASMAILVCLMMCGTMAVASNNPITGGTPTLSGIPTGVAAAGKTLSEAVAALISASASAPAAAAAASRAFPYVARNDLGADRVALIDWRADLNVTSLWSNKVVERCYMDLRQAKCGLAYIVETAESAARNFGKLMNAEKEAQLSSGWAPTWNRGTQFTLTEEKEQVERLLDRFPRVLEGARVARASCRDDLRALESELDVLMGISKHTIEGRTLGNPGAFFQKGIDRLNSDFFEPKHTGAMASRPAARHQQDNGEQGMSDDDDGHNVPNSLDGPEVASFVTDLHIARSAGRMLHASFQGVKMRLRRFFEEIQDEEKWATNTERDLGCITGHLGGAETPGELRLLAEEVMSLAKEWLNKIQERFY